MPERYRASERGAEPSFRRGLTMKRQTAGVTFGGAPPQEPWIDSRLVVRESLIDGCGLFFVKDVPAGTVLIRLGGTLVTSQELEDLIAEADVDASAPYIDTITVYEDAHLVLPPGSAIHFGNHSCDPTLWHIGAFELATRWDATAGEEATVDYGTQSGAGDFVMTCCCGSANCRGVITSDDWRRTDLQASYRGHWVPPLQARIDSL